MREVLAEVKQTEKEYWDVVYDTHLDPVDVEEVQRIFLRPCYEPGVYKRGDNLKAFHEILQSVWKGKHVLDYACGNGMWGVYFALTGAKKVNGFDLSEIVVRRARDRVEAQRLGNKVQFDVMDATNMKYSDNTFDIVIGHAVLHHTIKYPGIFEDLYRVMKPGTKAYFFENLADFPPFRLYWKIKGEVPEGDVPIFSKEVYKKAGMFSHVEIIGDDFLYSIKRYLWKENMGKTRRLLLKSAKKTDDILFYLFPTLRKWGSYSYIILTK